jgi:hypothetical protein
VDAIERVLKDHPSGAVHLNPEAHECLRAALAAAQQEGEGQDGVS